MAHPTIAFSIEGDVDLGTLETAISSLRELVLALQADHAPGSRVSWRVGDLRGGSAHIHLEANAESSAARHVAEKYEQLAADIRADRELVCSAAARRPVRRLVRLAHQKEVKSVTFATDDAAHSITRLGRNAARNEAATYAASDSVEGDVISLSRRNGLQLTLLDDIHQQAVTCHLSPEQCDLAEQAWRAGAARVSGMVTRDALTDRPSTVRDIARIDCLSDTDEHWDEDWKAARGSIPWKPGDPPAEVLIRRLRDEW